uniref:Uncharacterized protein n=1 Tax=Myotis myotis TaxID=51298 RepID=A0A7J7Y0J0_MYOMY|nr:hypothetical protein mMyoMyo1_011469 [Myotis myotis]
MPTRGRWPGRHRQPGIAPTLPAQTQLHYPSHRVASTRPLNISPCTYLDSQPKKQKLPAFSAPKAALTLTALSRLGRGRREQIRRLQLLLFSRTVNECSFITHKGLCTGHEQCSNQDRHSSSPERQERPS